MEVEMACQGLDPIQMTFIDDAVLTQVARPGAGGGTHVCIVAARE